MAEDSAQDTGHIGLNIDGAAALIADQLDDETSQAAIFGDDKDTDSGDVADDSGTPTTKAKGQSRELPDDVDDDDQIDIEDDADVQDDDTDADDDDDDAEASAEEEDGTDDDAGDEPATLQDIAEALEIPYEEFLANQQVTFKAAGEDVTVTLSDLTKGYQLEADVRKKSEAVAENRKRLQATERERDEQFRATSHQTAQVMNFVKAAVAQELQSPEMQSLRESDPGEWSARERDIQNRLGMLNDVARKAAEQYNQQVQQARINFMQTQGDILRDEVEGWGDEKMEEAVGVIESLGFSAEDLLDIGDARFIKGALELSTARQTIEELTKKVEALEAKTDENKTKAELAAKKVKKLPKTPIKSNSSKSKPVVGRNKVSKLKQKLKKTPTSGRENLDIAAAAIEELI